MKIKDYFVLAMKEKKYRQRLWLIRAFSVPVDFYTGTSYLDLVFSIDGFGFIDLNGNVEPIEVDYDLENRPLIGHKDRVDLVVGDMKNIIEPVTTTYGNAITNQLLFVYPFYDVNYDHTWFKGVALKVVSSVMTTAEKIHKRDSNLAGDTPNVPIPYQNRKISKKLLTNLIVPLLQNDKMSIPEYFEFMKAMDMLVVFNNILLISSTPRTLSPSPEALALRDKLVAENKDNLTDPNVAAMIDQAVVAADKESMKDDPSYDYFIKGKDFATVRKKLYGTQGGVPRLDDPTKVDYIARSLREGTRPEDMIAVTNSARSGSYDRGASTALGGAGVNETNRAYMNTAMTEDFCGTKVGLPVKVTSFSVDKIVDRYPLGKEEYITEEQAKKFIGKTILIHAPSTCNTINGHYCKRCMDKSVIESNVALGSQVAEADSVFLAIFLAAFHARELSTKLYDYDELLY